MNSAELRERIGMSRTDWARALNVSERTVVRWEDQGVDPGGTASEVMNGIVAALDEGANPTKVGKIVKLGGIRSLLCYGLTKKLSNGHVK